MTTQKVDKLKTYTDATKELRQTDVEQQYLEHLKIYHKALQDVECKLDTLKEIVLNGERKWISKLTKINY